MSANTRKPPGAYNFSGSVYEVSFTIRLIILYAYFESYNYLENYDFAKILIESSYALDYKIKNQNSEEIKEPKDIFIDKNSMNYFYDGNAFIHLCNPKTGGACAEVKIPIEL